MNMSATLMLHLSTHRGSIWLFFTEKTHLALSRLCVSLIFHLFCNPSPKQPIFPPIPRLFFLRNVTKDEMHLSMLKCVIKCINMQCSTFCTRHHHLQRAPPTCLTMGASGGSSNVDVGAMGACVKGF